MDRSMIDDGESVTMTINKQQFDVKAPYKEGHELNANEAGVLNQTFRENIRNNKHDQVGKMTADGADHASVQQMITDYVYDYEFGTRGSGGPRSSDPVQTEANRIARNLLKAAIQQAGGSKYSEYTTDQLRTLTKQVLDENPAIMDQAKVNVEATKSATDGVLSGMALPAGEAKKTEEDSAKA